MVNPSYILALQSIVHTHESSVFAHTQYFWMDFSEMLTPVPNPFCLVRMSG